MQRQPDEMEKAHNAWIAYCKLVPSQRTIAAARREIVEQASEDREFSEEPVSIAKRARLSERDYKAGKRFICALAHG